MAATKPSAPDITAPAEVNKQIETFFSLIESSQAEKALDGIIASSPLWANKTGVKEQLLAQVQAAEKIYGPISGHELASMDSQGTMLLRQYWFAQHRDMVTRWEFDFVRSAKGWTIAYFGFTDQAPNWF